VKLYTQILWDPYRHQHLRDQDSYLSLQTITHVKAGFIFLKAKTRLSHSFGHLLPNYKPRLATNYEYYALIGEENIYLMNSTISATNKASTGNLPNLTLRNKTEYRSDEIELL